MKGSRIILLAVVAALIAAFFVFDLGQYFTLDYFREQRQAIADFQAQNPWLVGVAFFVLYVVATALALPAAALLTLVAGALFGLWLGVVIVSFASSIGATLAFVIARYLFRDAVRSRFARQLSAIDRGIEKDGAFYLFAMRLVPAFPFFAINSGDVGDARAYLDVLLGQPNRHAGRHGGVCERRRSARSARFARRHPLAGADRLVRVAGRLSAHRQEGAGCLQGQCRSAPLQEAKALRRQHGGRRRWFRRSGGGADRSDGEGQSDPDRASQDGRRLSEHRLRAEQSAAALGKDALLRFPRRGVRLQEGQRPVRFRGRDGARPARHQEDRASRLRGTLYRPRRGVRDGGRCRSPLPTP